MAKTNVRIARSDGDLRKASSAVNYESSMMGTTLHVMLNREVDINSSPMEHCISNSVLHAFLIATRNLCHFLYSHEPRSTDIIAEDFFDHPSDWCGLRPPLPAEFTDGSFVDRISKRLVHLTWQRASGTKPTWGAFRIAWELSKSLEAFVCNVNPLRVATEIVEDVAALKLTLDGLATQHGSVEEIESVPTSMMFQEIKKCQLVFQRKVQKKKIRIKLQWLKKDLKISSLGK